VGSGSRVVCTYLSFGFSGSRNISSARVPPPGPEMRLQGWPETRRTKSLVARPEPEVPWPEPKVWPHHQRLGPPHLRPLFRPHLRLRPHSLPSRGSGTVHRFNMHFLNLSFHYQFVLWEGSWPRNTARPAGLPGSLSTNPGSDGYSHPTPSLPDHIAHGRRQL
jgi:hypothetical protein